jgi:hypothetical protein
MNRPNKSPLIPDSLAADGIKGRGAKASDRCKRDDTPSEAVALLLARVAIHSAQSWLDRYAALTADPVAGAVEASDLLDQAAEAIRPKVRP